jgi:hypothetical protein
MKEATPEELRQRYQELSDDQLIVLAAEASELTPAAAVALEQELKCRKVIQHDRAETGAAVRQWRAGENAKYAGTFNLRKQFGYRLTDLVYFLGMICVLLLVGGIAKLFCHSPESVNRFQRVASLAIFLSYCLWRVAEAINKARRKKLLDNTTRQDSVPPA